MRLFLTFKGQGDQGSLSRDYPSCPKGRKWSSTATSGTRTLSWPWGDSLPQMPAVRSRSLGSKNPLIWHRENWFRIGAGAVSASMGTLGVNGVHFHFSPTHTPDFSATVTFRDAGGVRMMRLVLLPRNCLSPSSSTFSKSRRQKMPHHLLT